jgi:hypothetical protein
VAAIEQATRTDWIPAEYQIAIDRAVLEELGEQALIDFVVRYTEKAGDLPLFGSIARGAMNLFGGGPMAAFRIAPRTWGFAARHCGAMEVDVLAERDVRVRYVDLPEVLRDPVMAVTTHGGVIGMVSMFRLTPRVETDDTALRERGIVSHRVRW